MDLGLTGKGALVLAAGGGLGQAIAETLAREGARVALTDRDEASLKRVADSIVKGGGAARSFVADLGNAAELETMVNDAERELGTIDILVNLTGGPPGGPMSGVSAESWTKYFQMMVLSVTQVTDRVLPGMRKRGWGRVITSTSSGVIVPIPDLGLSNALRSALVGWSKTLAREVAADGVTANVIVPGRIATARIRQLDEMRASREGRPFDDIVATSVSTIPMRRYGEPQEYADAVAFLASTKASYITGSMLRVDGGLVASI